MSSIKLESNASGTGIFTIASPNSNTNRTLTLPDATGTIITTAGGAAISGTTGTFTGLVDISAAGAGQIKFPATQNASTNANTLDDYEEGTWTAVISDGTNNATMSANRTTGNYIKIGKLVYLTNYIGTDSLGSVTGSIRITGLPFTNGSGNGSITSHAFGHAENLNISANQVVGGNLNANDSFISLTLWDSTAGTTNLQATEWSSDGTLWFGFTYIAA